MQRCEPIWPADSGLQPEPSERARARFPPRRMHVCRAALCGRSAIFCLFSPTALETRATPELRGGLKRAFGPIRLSRPLPSPLRRFSRGLTWNIPANSQPDDPWHRMSQGSVVYFSAEDGADIYTWLLKGGLWGQGCRELWNCPVVKDWERGWALHPHTRSCFPEADLLPVIQSSTPRMCFFGDVSHRRVLENRTRVGDVSDTQWQPRHSRVCKNEIF